MIKERVQESTRSPIPSLAFKILLLKKKSHFFHIPCLIDDITEIFFGLVGVSLLTPTPCLKME